MRRACAIAPGARAGRQHGGLVRCWRPFSSSMPLIVTAIGDRQRGGSIRLRPTSAAARPRNVALLGRSGAAPSSRRWSNGSRRSSASSARRASSLMPSDTPSRAGRGLTRFLDDGRVEIDSNVVGRAIRPIALNRKNALFAGSDGGGEHWAVIASLVQPASSTPSTRKPISATSSTASSLVILRASSKTYCPGPTRLSRSRPWRENSGYPRAFS